MKILIYTNVLPFPLDEGGKVAQFTFLSELCREHSVVLVVEKSDASTLNAASLSQKLPNLKILLVGTNRNDREKISFFRKCILYGSSHLLDLFIPQKVGEQIFQNQSFLIPVKVKSKQIIEEIAKIVDVENPDLIQIDFIDNADLVFALPMKIKKILVIIDLRFSSVLQSCKINNQGEIFGNYLGNYVKMQETAAIQNYDGIITYSIEDNSRILSHIVSAKTLAVPFAVEDSKFVKVLPENEISKIVFIGPCHHPPNLDAVVWYIEEIGMSIFEKFGLKLNVVGKWTEGNKNRFSKCEFVHFAGFVDDLEAFMDGAVLLVPLRIGSGIRTKIIEAFAMGVPVISSTIGAEGLGVNSGQHILIADTPDEFTQSLGSIIVDEELRQTIRHSALDFCKLTFSQKIVYDKRIGFYNQILSGSV